MIGRMGTLAVAGAMALGLPGAALAGSTGEHHAVFSREDEDGYAVLVVDDDDDDAARMSAALDTHGDDSSDHTSGVDSNDATGSGYSAVSRDRDRSRGDLTRDRTRDGGDRTRDRSAHHTNDPSRNDTR